MSVFTRPILPCCVALLIIGCTYNPSITYDRKALSDQAQFQADKQRCEAMADQIDLSNDAIGTSTAFGFASGLGVAGIGAAIYGTVYAEAIPFIVGATYIGGHFGVDWVKRKEQRQKTKLLGQCMRDEGYRVYTHN